MAKRKTRARLSPEIKTALGLVGSELSEEDFDRALDALQPEEGDWLPNEQGRFSVERIGRAARMVILLAQSGSRESAEEVLASLLETLEVGLSSGTPAGLNFESVVIALWKTTHEFGLQAVGVAQLTDAASVDEWVDAANTLARVAPSFLGSAISIGRCDPLPRTISEIVDATNIVADIEMGRDFAQKVRSLARGLPDAVKALGKDVEARLGHGLELKNDGVRERSQGRPHLARAKAADLYELLLEFVPAPYYYEPSRVRTYNTNALLLATEIANLVFAYTEGMPNPLSKDQVRDTYRGRVSPT